MMEYIIPSILVIVLILSLELLKWKYDKRIKKQIKINSNCCWSCGKELKKTDTIVRIGKMESHLACWQKWGGK